MATRAEIRYGAGRSSFNSVRTSATSAELPWLCSGEWETVYNWLYSSKSDLVEEGLSRVGAWRSRGVVPLMVELTVDLCQCRLRERGKSDSGNGAQSLILQYSMAITRFINGVGEICKQKLGMRADLTTCVHQYGVPSWVVTLRHMGTHQQLPSIGAMRSGAEFCLSWLRVNYWRPQRLMLNKCFEDRCSMSPDSRWDGSSLAPTPSSVCVKTSRDKHVESLTSGLCHSVKELETLLERASYTELAESLKKKQILQFSSPNKFSLKVPLDGDLDALPALTVGEREMKIWFKHLQKVASISQSFKQRLLSALVVAIHQDEDNNSRLRDFLCGWLHYLLTKQQGVRVEKAGKVEVLQILEEKEEEEDAMLLPGEVDWLSFLHVLIQHPGHYTYPLVKLVCRNLRQSPVHGILHDILHMSQMVTVSSRIGNIYTSHYQEGSHTNRANELMASVMKAQSSKESLMSASSTCVDRSGHGNRWEVVENVEEWLQCPLGMCPGQSLGAHMLSVIPQDRQLVIIEDCDSDVDMEDHRLDSTDNENRSRQDLQLTQEELLDLEQALLELY